MPRGAIYYTADVKYPLQVTGEAAWRGTPVPGQRLQQLLRVLVDAGASGASEQHLIREVWGNDPPAHPRKALHVLIARLRAATQPDLVVRTTGGYALSIERELVDAYAAADLLDGAHAAYTEGADRDAAEFASKVLAIREDPDALRVHALALARLGEIRAALPNLRSIVESSPSDDHAAATLIRSLAMEYGAAAALEEFARIRERLQEDLGVNPGPALDSAFQETLAADAPTRAGIRYAITPLVGRDDDLAGVKSLLGVSRLVTITGPGGIGKTRLAHEVGAHSSEPVVHVVELGLTHEGDVGGAVASALDLRINPRPSLPAQIAQKLQGPPNLLIVDNCEHVRAECAELLGFLLAQCPGLTILTTSRAPLGITGEEVYELPPLMGSAGRELFMQRARAIRAHAELDAGLVDELVTQVDGLALGIELAAARIRTMGVPEILSGVTTHLASSPATPPLTPPRHQGLENVIEWSWRLLSPQARRTLMHVSVFPGSFSRSSAEAVAGEGVDELVDHSLVRTVETVSAAGPQLRFTLLRTIRQFAKSKLEHSGEREQVRTKFRSWAARHCRNLDTQLFGAAQMESLAWIKTEELNLLAALDVAVAQAHEPDLFAILAVIAGAWTIRTEQARLLSLLDDVETYLSSNPEIPEAARTHAWIGLSALLLFYAMTPWASPRPSTLTAWERLAAENRDAPAPLWAAFSTLTARLQSSSSPDALLEMLDNNDRLTAALAGALAALSIENAGAPASAAAVVSSALDRLHPEDPPWPRSLLHSMLSNLHLQLGQYEQAAARAQEALPVVNKLGSTSDALQLEVINAVAAMSRGEIDHAEAHLHRLLDPGRTGNAGRPTMLPRLALSEVQFLRNTPDAAGQSLHEAFAAARQDVAGAHEESNPWLLISMAVAVAQSAVYANGNNEEQWRSLIDLTKRASADGKGHYDLPVLGSALYATSLWALLHGRMEPAAAERMLTLALQSGYNQALPCLRPHHLAARIGISVPDLVPPRSPSHLVKEIRDAVDALTPTAGPPAPPPPAP